MKNLLIIKLHSDICGDEIGLIEHQAQLLGMGVCIEQVANAKEMEDMFRNYQGHQSQFDYIYLCTHADKDGFEINVDGKSSGITWADFGLMICEYSIFTEDSVFLLACCRGGLFQVATDMFAVCPQISYVCGVKWTLTASDLATGFVVFLYNMIKKRAEPLYAAQKASLATDFSFVCHDRAEVESHPQYNIRRYQIHLALGWIDIHGNPIDFDKIVEEAEALYPNPETAIIQEEKKD